MSFFRSYLRKGMFEKTKQKAPSLIERRWIYRGMRYRRKGDIPLTPEGGTHTLDSFFIVRFRKKEARIKTIKNQD